MPRQLAALAGLGALSDLDLQLVGVDQIVGAYAKARRSHLLNGAAPPVAVGVFLEPPLVFAALAGVASSANAVHRDRQRLVGFLADGAERHCTRTETLDDLLDRFDLFERHGLIRLLEFEQASQRTHGLVRVVDCVGEFLEGF